MYCLMEHMVMLVVVRYHLLLSMRLYSWLVNINVLPKLSCFFSNKWLFLILWYHVYALASIIKNCISKVEKHYRMMVMVVIATASVCCVNFLMDNTFPKIIFYFLKQLKMQSNLHLWTPITIRIHSEIGCLSV